MNVTIDLVNASSENKLPQEQDFQHWTEAALKAIATEGSQPVSDSSELSIKLVGEAESASLNKNFRQKDGPTNILSFPYAEIHGSNIELLGDIAICAPLVKKEAAEQNKKEEAHWAHLTIHGVLHLNGFDHEHPGEAEAMESLEIRILDSMGFANPYETEPLTR